jgi:RNA polymerase sigma-70 factor (ECF subfamily)
MGIEQALPHLPRLRRYAQLLTGEATRADDLVQDTLERACRKWSLWRAPGPEARRPDGSRADPGLALRAWLLTLMHNLYLNQLRDRRRDDAHAELTPELEPLHEPFSHTAERMDLERALARITPLHREVLLLVCVEEFSYDEAARVLDIPIGTVMSRLSRARDALRKLMEGAPPRARLEVVKR